MWGAGKVYILACVLGFSQQQQQQNETDSDSDKINNWAVLSHAVGRAV